MKRMIQAEISIGTQVEHRQLSQSNNEIFCKKRQSKYSPQRDNGTNFVGAEREVEEYVAALNKEGIEEHLVQRGISWKFNPPAAPFSLGVWERFLRRCEKTMYAVLGNRSVREDVLSTTMCIVEETLKARPLTPVSSDVNDLEAMTPNHFLLGNRNVCLPYLLCVEVIVDHRKLFRQTQAYANLIWYRFREKRLPTLNNRQKRRSKSNETLKEGDLVQLVDDSHKRGYYNQSRVTEMWRLSLLTQ